MSSSRREFLRQSSAYSLGFLALRQCVQTAVAAGAPSELPTTFGYGPLVPDPKGLLDLPAGFTYKIVSRAGDAMDDGLLVPGGFGIRGVEGMVEAVRWAREQKLPFLGICLGLQTAIVEFARNVCKIPNTNSSEFEPDCENPVIALMRSQEGIQEMGGTMRLGAYPCKLRPGSRVAQIYGSAEVSERHRHRYEVSNAYRDVLAEFGMRCSGLSPDGSLVEMIELPDHPWFIGCQFHPELKSRPTRPHPLFAGFIGAARQHQRNAPAAAAARQRQPSGVASLLD